MDDGGSISHLAGSRDSPLGRPRELARRATSYRNADLTASVTRVPISFCAMGSPQSWLRVILDLRPGDPLGLRVHRALIDSSAAIRSLSHSFVASSRALLMSFRFSTRTDALCGRPMQLGAPHPSRNFGRSYEPSSATPGLGSPEAASHTQDSRSESAFLWPQWRHGWRRRALPSRPSDRPDARLSDTLQRPSRAAPGADSGPLHRAPCRGPQDGGPRTLCLKRRPAGRGGARGAGGAGSRRRPRRSPGARRRSA